MADRIRITVNGTERPGVKLEGDNTSRQTGVKKTKQKTTTTKKTLLTAPKKEKHNGRLE